MQIVITDRETGTCLAKGQSGEDVISYEGNWYFDPSAVNQQTLRLTERTYTCPHKGTCHWVDAVESDGRTTRDAAWVYADPKPGHEAIKGRYGFYAGTRGATRQE